MPSKRQKKKKQGEAAKGSSTPQTRIQSSSKPADEAQAGSKSEEPIEQPNQTGTGPVSKPPPPIVKNVQDQSVSLKLQKSPTGVTVKYRVEYKELKSDSEAEEKEPWLVIDTTDENFTLTGLESGKQYLIRYRTVDEVGVSEPSDTVILAFGAPDVIVGGNGGDPFSFKCTSSIISNIKVTYNETNLCTIEATFGTGRLVKVGNSAGPNPKTLELGKNDNIVEATLWPNSQNNMCAGLQFMVANSNTGKRESFFVKCNKVGNPVTVNVMSGRCFGIIGRSGEGIDALGLCFK